MKKIRRKILLGASILMVLLLTAGIILSLYGRVLFQEGNPVPIVKSIITLESKDVDYIPFSEIPLKYISKSTMDKEKLIKKYMEQKDWIYVEQIGNSYFFTKDGEERSVSTRQFTKKYFIWLPPADASLEDK